MKISPEDIQELIEAAIEYGESKAVHDNICEMMASNMEHLFVLHQQLLASLNPEQVN